jgi:hypothetical protein
MFKASSNSGPYDHGLAVRRTGYLSFDHVKAVLGSSDKNVRVVLDRLLLANVLRRGLVLRCDRCDRLDFYRLETVGPTFDCGQCQHRNPLRQQAWRQPVAEPSWFYDLDPVVRDLLDQNGDVPLLAAAQVRHAGRASPSTSAFELEILKSGQPWVELDIVVIRDGLLTLGEAKKMGHLKVADKPTRQAATKLAQAAVALSADRFVLATALPAWAQGVADAMQQALEAAAATVAAPIPTLEVLTDVRSSWT